MLAPCFVEKTALVEPRLRRLFEYWEQKRGLRKAPLRAEINPAEIPDLLGFLNLYEVRTKPRDYLVRLNGSEVAAAIRRDATGMVLSEVIVGDAGARCRKAFAMCVDHWTPTFVETPMSFCGRDHTIQRILALPLSKDGRHADMIVSAHAFRPVGRIVHELPGAGKVSN
jgi:hypothetical protein